MTIDQFVLAVCIAGAMFVAGHMVGYNDGHEDGDHRARQIVCPTHQPSTWGRQM